MPNNFENNFSNTHLNLISDGLTFGAINVENGDYIRIIVNGQTFLSDTISTTEGDITGINGFNDFKIYKDNSDSPNYFIKPNDLLD